MIELIYQGDADFVQLLIGGMCIDAWKEKGFKGKKVKIYIEELGE